MGVLDEMLTVLARDADLEWLMIDSTIASACGWSPQGQRGRMPRAWAGLAVD